MAAVRDLYGTVLNEGATKGILVTTSDYGPDAYGFAKDKPLVLMGGANLLHLLEKHGHSGQRLISSKRENSSTSSEWARGQCFMRRSLLRKQLFEAWSESIDKDYARQRINSEPPW